MNRYTTTAKKNSNNDKTFIILSDRYIPQYKYLGNYGEIIVNGKQLLSIQIEEILKSDIKAEIIVVTGYRAKYITNKSKKVRYIENVLYEETGEVESLRLALNANISKNVFIMSGNTMLSVKDINEMTVENSISIRLEDDPKIAHRNMGVIYNEKNISLSMVYRCKNLWNGVVYIKEDLMDTLYNEVNKSKKTLEYCEVIKNIVNENFKVIEQKNTYKINGSVL